MAFETMAEVVGISMKVFIFVMALAAGGMASKKKHYTAMVIIIIAFIVGILFAGGISLVASIGYLMWASAQEKKAKGTTAAVAAPAAVATPIAVTTTPIVKSSSKEKKEIGNKIRCRFCKKLYSADYNGCPYCKKK